MTQPPVTLFHRTSNPYEVQFGYSRGVCKGPFIFISGTTSIDPSTQTLLHPDSAYDQAKEAFTTIIGAVEALGGTSKDIVRVRMFVSNDEDCNDVGKALKESLGNNVDSGPAATMIVGARFVHAMMKVEIEADAIVL
ncbi:YjgF-like protein [Amanita muscaria]